MAGTFEGLTDLEWHLFADLFPPEPVKRGRGMPHTPFRRVVNTLLYVLITGSRWCDIPCGPQWASKSAAHRWLQRWPASSVIMPGHDRSIKRLCRLSRGRALSLFDQKLEVGLRGLFDRRKRLFLAVPPGRITGECLDSGAPAAIVFLFELDPKELSVHGLSCGGTGVREGRIHQHSEMARMWSKGPMSVVSYRPPSCPLFTVD